MATVPRTRSPVMFESSRTHIERAIEVVDREREIIADERTSFQRFHARLSKVEPRRSAAVTATAGTVGGASVSMHAESPVDASLQSVRTAFRETVMDVPHFADEYGDSLEESLATEFGVEVAAQVVDGTQLTPVLYRTLSQGAMTAVRDRKSFQQTLARERDSLLEIRSGLDECERRVAAAEERLGEAPSSRDFGALDERLAAIEETCTALVDERQSLVHGRSGVNLSGVTGTSLMTYLYGEGEASCPALAALADAVDAIRDRRQRCLR